MTYRISNLQLNALRLFTAQRTGSLTLKEFAQIDQRITSGLGRRKEPLVVKSAEDEYSITPAGMELTRAMEQTDVFRKLQSLSVAKCFAHVSRRKVYQMRRGKVA